MSFGHLRAPSPNRSFGRPHPCLPWLAFELELEDALRVVRSKTESDRRLGSGPDIGDLQPCAAHRVSRKVINGDHRFRESGLEILEYFECVVVDCERLVRSCVRRAAR